MLSSRPSSDRSRELLEMLFLDCFLLMTKISFEFKIYSDFFSRPVCWSLDRLPKLVLSPLCQPIHIANTEMHLKLNKI